LKEPIIDLDFASVKMTQKPTFTVNR